MEIELIISTDTLGSINTAADSQRYADEVKSRIQQFYPFAEISACLSDTPCDAICHISDYEDYYESYEHVERVSEHVERIAQTVWDRADY